MQTLFVAKLVVFAEVTQLIYLFSDKRYFRCASLLRDFSRAVVTILILSILIAGLDNDNPRRLHQSCCNSRTKKFIEPSLHGSEILDELHDIDLLFKHRLTFLKKTFVSIWFEEAA